MITAESVRRSRTLFFPPGYIIHTANKLLRKTKRSAGAAGDHHRLHHQPLLRTLLLPSPPIQLANADIPWLFGSSNALFMPLSALVSPCDPTPQCCVECWVLTADGGSLTPGEDARYGTSCCLKHSPLCVSFFPDFMSCSHFSSLRCVCVCVSFKIIRPVVYLLLHVLPAKERKTHY